MMPQRLVLVIALSVFTWSGAVSTSGQDPGVTKPTLEALVGNSAQIAVVRVRSFKPAPKKGANELDRLDFDVLETLKRSWVMPTEENVASSVGAAGSVGPGQGTPLSTASTLTFTGPAISRFRSYDHADWGYDFTAPVESIDRKLAAWHEKQTDLLLFKDSRRRK